MCNNLGHPNETQMAPRLRTTGLNNKIQQKIKLIPGENAVEPSIYTALLSIFFSQSEKKRRFEICISEISGPGIKKRNGIEIMLMIIIKLLFLKNFNFL